MVAAAGVLESAVIGIPHKDFGEAVFAVIVPQKGMVLEAEKVLAERFGHRRANGIH